jgi:diadenosine tetraphosphate (Ap4A) HIT family hydrolase
VPALHEGSILSDVEESITVFANQSGRLWSDDPDAWRRLSSEGGCPICVRLASGDATNVIAATTAVLVTAEPDATLPGYVCVTSRHHVVEPFELSARDQSDFFLDAMSVARAVSATLTPTKMNYEIHGNTIPHLHMHLYPRQADDPYVGYMITNRVWFRRGASALRTLAEGIKGELENRGRLASWP